jgi:hypothetical protein
MITITRTYSNGFERTLKIIASRYGNIDKNCIIITTEEDGDIAISAPDTPDFFAEILDVAPPPVIVAIEGE